MTRGTRTQLMARSALAVERERLERAIACAPTRYDEQRLGAKWADVTFRLECEERALLAHHPVGRASARATGRAGSGVTPPPGYQLPSTLAGPQPSPRSTRSHV